mgnify:CR=1 FL=1
MGFHRLSRRQWELLWQLPLLLALLLGLNQLLGYLELKPVVQLKYLHPQMPPAMLAIAFGGLFLQLLAQEIVFRGFLQNFARARWGRWLAVPLVALLDMILLSALFDLPPFPAYLLMGFAVSCGLSLMQERQRNLWAPTLASLALNLWNLCSGYPFI